MKLKLPELPPAQLLAILRAHNLLPAIIFLPARRRCDEAAVESALAAKRNDQDPRQVERREIAREFILEHPEVGHHRHLQAIIRGGVAAHHAGHIPSWKLLIERVMSAGLLDAIFATSTVAAGVDFPARTVVISHADRRDSNGWRNLTASELQQMTGRAGRRGRDLVGFAVVAPSLHQDPQQIAKLLVAVPDPLESQFRATYTTLLNLLDAYGNFAQVRAIAEKSFAYRDTAHSISQLEQERAALDQEIEGMLREQGCPYSAATARGFERLASARARLQESAPLTRAEVRHTWLDKTVAPGRIVGLGRSGKRCVFVTWRYGENVGGVKEDGQGTSIALDRIGSVFEKNYQIREGDILRAFAEARSGENGRLTEPRLRDMNAGEDEGVAVIDDVMDRFTPPELTKEERSRYDGALWSVMLLCGNYERASRGIENLREEIWEPFERRARVLHHFGYLDFVGERVTEAGRWLADLRVDRPLLVGEALRQGLLDDLEPQLAAALMAALAADSDRDFGELELNDTVMTALTRFEEIAYDVATAEWNEGVEPGPEMNLSAAATAWLWAGEAEWPELVRETKAEEGDLVRMLSRTGESLLQIAKLRETQPRAARIAAAAAELALREPVRQ